MPNTEPNTQIDTPLPLDYQPNPPPRPTRYDAAVKRAAAERMMPEIVEWLGKDWKEADREEYISDLIGIAHLWDGYEAAKELERGHHWAADAQLVEILDGATAAWVAENEAVKAWVETNQIKPALAVGDRVATKRQGEGAIVAIHLDTATYVVQTDEYLAERPQQAGLRGGYVIAYEDVTPIDKPDETP